MREQFVGLTVDRAGAEAARPLMEEEGVDFLRIVDPSVTARHLLDELAPRTCPINKRSRIRCRFTIVMLKRVLNDACSGARMGPNGGRSRRMSGSRCLNGNRMRFEPRRELVFVAVALRHRLHQVDDRGFFGLNLPTVEPQKNIHRHEGRPFISVTIPVVTGKAHAVRGGEPHDARIVSVRLEMLRAGEGRLNRSFVPDARKASVLLQLIVVNCIDDLPGKPAGSVHLRRENYWSESARRAFR